MRVWRWQGSLVLVVHPALQQSAEVTYTRTPPECLRLAYGSAGVHNSEVSVIGVLHIPEAP